MTRMNFFVLLISINGFNYQKVILRIPAINMHMHITHTHNVEPMEIILMPSKIYIFIFLYKTYLNMSLELMERISKS